ncbi:MAG: AraC family transcriptional regulator [Pseudobdellovibrionaceae bacterium]|nr:AraC family transcriptional regulator [Pseudobdellovibrionaceae bacterium]
MRADRSQHLNLHGMQAFGLLPSHVEMIRINDLAPRLSPKIPFPHKHSFFQIVIILDGTGWHEIDFARHAVHKGMTFVLKPGQVHAWDLSPDTKGFLVEFEFHAIKKIQTSQEPLAQLYALPDQFGLTHDQEQKVRDLCLEMMNEQKDLEPGWETILQLRLLTLLFLFFRYTPAPAATSDKNLILHNFFKLVNACYARHHNIEFYAEKLGLTPKALTMRVTRFFGEPPKKIIQDRCLLEAKRLLAYSTKTNSEIARKIGFDDPNYFSRLFRSKTGMTPNEFRVQQTTPQDKFPRV